jgi:Peptidase family M23
MVSLVVAALLGTAVASSAATPAAPPPAGADRDVITGLVASVLAPPRPVLEADGRQHLVYELQLTNPVDVAITIDQVEALDAASDQVLGALEGDAVAAAMDVLPLAGEPTEARLGPGGGGFLFMDLALAEGAEVPRGLVHRFGLSFEPDPGFPGVVRIAATDVVRERPVVIGPPLRGARWVALTHPMALNPVNGAIRYSQRFALDFLQLNAEGRLFEGPPEELSSYPFYGADVLSVAAGEVVRVKDGIPDNTPVGSLPPDLTFETAPGNHVVVDIGGGRFASYAHLQPGSLTVEVGDHVKRGQVLGLLGNSGNSDAPHLHFQVADAPLPLDADGLPYGFRFFDSEGTLANPEEVLAGGVAIIDPALSGPHSRQLPLNLQVISF